MKTVITGGAGFIGSHLAERLLGKGQQVVAIDNFSTGSRENVAHLAGHPGFELVEGDVLDTELVTYYLEDAAQMYHLAASVGVKHIMDNLIDSIQNNIEGTASVLRAAAKDKIPTLITSTSEVYGKHADTASKETDDLRMGETSKSRWSYACSKALDEYLAFAFGYEHNLPVVVVRLFNTVGDRQTDAYGMVVPTFVRQALAGKNITIHGDGEQSRSFCYVKDVVWALTSLMADENARGEVYNVGADEPVTINELADSVIAITQSSSKKIYIPYETAYKPGFEDAQSRRPDISKVSEQIGFNPQHSLEDIIKLVMRFEQQAGKKVPARTP